jgi:poly-gamma-glutamate synthesis protein (capsule biosynthesis protein)
MGLEILIGANLSPTASNIGEFQSSAPKLLFDGLEEIWRAADARIITLETPLSGETAPQTSSATLAIPASCAAGISALNPTGVCLCNNHIMDAGVSGLRSTRAALKAKKITAFGAGEDLDEADQPYFFAKHGVRIGIYAVCEHEFSFATDRRAGANPLDLVNLSDRIREIKSNCDRLIVLYHGGREGYPYPSPDVQKTCRKIAECGASLIICQHSQCVGSSERWNNATIVYGQGNFIFDPANGADWLNTGMLVHYRIGDYGADYVDFVPIVRAGGGAALADKEKAADILEEFSKRSLHIRVEGFVGARYEAFAAEHRQRLFSVFLNGNVLLRTLSALSGHRPLNLYDRKSKSNILRTLRCESARELIIYGLTHEVCSGER